MIRPLTYREALQVLLLQAASDGRGKTLFGDSFFRVRELLSAFISGRVFPDIFLEFPLTGEYAALGRQLKNRKIADSRLETALDMTFTKQIPVGSTDGGTGRYLLLLIPQWIKIRWIRGVIQPAKLYCFVKAG